MRNVERLGLRRDFEAAVEDEIRSAEIRLGRGQAMDFAAYKATVAQIEAYRRCVGLFLGIHRGYVEEEEDEEIEERNV